MGCAAGKPAAPQPRAAASAAQAPLSPPESVLTAGDTPATEGHGQRTAEVDAQLDKSATPLGVAVDVAFVGPCSPAVEADTRERLKLLGLTCTFSSSPATIVSSEAPISFDPFVYPLLWRHRDFPRILDASTVHPRQRFLAQAERPHEENILSRVSAKFQQGLMVIGGPPRSGKSTAMAYLSRQWGQQHVVYFFRRGDRAADAIWGIAQQLRGMGLEHTSLQSDDVLGFGLGHLLEALVLRPAREVEWPPTLVLLDGVDECEDGADLRNVLTTVALTNRPPWLCFVASCREGLRPDLLLGSDAKLSPPPEPSEVLVEDALWDDFAWLQAAVFTAVARSGRDGVHRLARDCPLPQTANLLDLAARALSKHPRELAEQAIGRLPESHPLVHEASKVSSWQPCPGRSGLAPAMRERVLRLEGQRYAFASADCAIICLEKSARVVDARTGNNGVVLQGHLNKIAAVAAAWPWAVTCGGNDGVCVRWDLRDGQGIPLEGHSLGVTCCTVLANVVVTGSKDCTARVWDANLGNLLREIKHEAAVVGVAFCLDGLLVTSDGTAKMWNSLQVVHLGPAVHVGCGGGGRAVTTHQHIAELWESDGHRLSSLSVVVENVSCTDELCALSLKGGLILVVDWDFVPLCEHNGRHAVLGPEGLVMASRGSSSLEIFSIADPSPPANDAHSKDITAMAVHGALGCTVSFDRWVRLWNLSSGLLMSERGGLGRLKAVCMDASRIVIGDLEGRLLLLDHELRSLVEWHSRSVYHVAISNQWVASLHSDIGHACNTLRLWKAADGSLVDEIDVEAPLVALALCNQVAHMEDHKGRRWTVDVAAGEVDRVPCQLSRPLTRHGGLTLDVAGRREGGTVFGFRGKTFFAWTAVGFDSKSEKYLGPTV